MSGQPSHNSRSPEAPPEGRCAYTFRHPLHPRQYCGREVDHHCRGGDYGLASGGRACFWHCRCTHSVESAGCVKPSARNLATRLEQDVKENRYLEGAYLEGAYLEKARLRKLQLPGAHLERAELFRADLKLANLTGAHLERAHIWEGKLGRATLWDAQLEGADLRGAALDGTHLQLANLRGAILYQGDLECAYLELGDLREADLRYAQLQGAHLEHARLTGARLHGAIIDYRTRCQDTDWGTPREEAEGRWDQAAAVFRMIGQHYRQNGDYERAHEFYLKEMRCHHRFHVRDAPPGEFRRTVVGWAWRVVSRACQARDVKPLMRPIKRRWLWRAVEGRLRRRFTRPGARLIWGLHRWLWGYGGTPSRLLIWIGVTIVASAFVFLGAGIEKAAGGIVSHSFWDAFTLSLITFSTLGYGDWRPAGYWGHFGAGVESVAGVLLCAAFLVSLATKYVHRD